MENKTVDPKEKIAQAEDGVKRSQVALAKAEEVLAGEERRLAEQKQAAEAADTRRRAADPFEEKDFLRREQEARIASAKVVVLEARVLTAREAVETARNSVADAQHARDLLRLEVLQAKVLAERERVDGFVRRAAEGVLAELRKLHEATVEAERLFESVDGYRQVRLTALPDGRYDAAVLRAADGAKPGEALVLVGEALERVEIEPLPLLDSVRQDIERSANARARYADKLMREALEREAEKSRGKPEPAIREGVSLRELASLEREGLERAKGTHEGDYTPAIG